MAKVGDTVESPAAGTRVVFQKTARDTNGELLQLDIFMRGGGRVPFEHVHPYQEERFDVLSGTARVSMRGQERDVGVGQTVVVPAGTPHVWGNPSEEELHVIVELRPALKMETWFETVFGLQRDGKADPKNGLPNLLQLALIAREYEFYLARPPLFVQRVLFGLLAPIGKLLGYKARYPEYSGEEELLPRAERERETPSAASGPMRRAVVVGAGLAVVGILLLGRRLRSGRRR
jgi:mannose-6-phosphate isomerase-like protein (cupin superfamily)